MNHLYFNFEQVDGRTLSCSILHLVEISEVYHYAGQHLVTSSQLVGQFREGA